MKLAESITPTFGPGLSLIILVCVLTGIFVYGAALAKTPADVSKGIELVSKQKSIGEGLASLLEDSYRDKEINSKDYKKGKRLYIDAKGAFDGWLDRLQFQLEAGRSIESSEEYKASLQDAVTKAVKFTVYVDKLIFGEPRGPVAGVIVGLLEPLTNVGLEIWKEWKAANKHERERLIKKLESLKWKPFDQVRSDNKL